MHPYICSTCGKWFPGLGDIMYHLDTVHSTKFTNKTNKTNKSNKLTSNNNQDRTKDKAKTELNTEQNTEQNTN